MTKEEAYKRHIKECKNRIENIQFWMANNSDAKETECRENIEVLELTIQALEELIGKGIRSEEK